MAIPYKDSSKGKKGQIIDMFNNIAFKYDFLNHALSLNIDKIWRNKAIKAIKKNNPKKILDVATGTGDFAILSAKKLSAEKIVGIDISKKMLEVGQEKVKKMNLQNLVDLQLGDSEAMIFEENTFDAITVGFGVRNFENLEQGLREMHRVLTQNGVAAILEFSMPKYFPIKQLYTYYFRYVLPLIGKLFSKDYDAYYYLFQSVQEFPSGQNFVDIAHTAGFKHTKIVSLSFGIASLYLCTK
ncbi:MAG: bifunctional demethylmenaquinone methyltransferase/2-methoxy-6-polyprenyl-1,4-benzoquinol methylase UbiE [Bacteroidales bacterium]|nr:bifunctional demethylmenaquinone methyltransferase/2-methoxy-6-polyprenyl-1,4-benzoquinol methylase UbiE [Bacteroidales bacterium]